MSVDLTVPTVGVRTVGESSHIGKDSLYFA